MDDIPENTGDDHDDQRTREQGEKSSEPTASNKRQYSQHKKYVPEPPTRYPQRKRVREPRPRNRLKPMIDSDTRSMEEGKVGGEPKHIRTSLTAPTPAKTCFFYKDDDYTQRAVRLAIHERKYKKFDVLLGELSKKLPGLNYGVRGIFTPEGRDKVESFDQLTADHKYVCSTSRYKVKGLDINKVDRLTVWNSTRPPSGRRELNSLVRDFNIRGRQGRVGKRDSAMANAYITNMPKKITIMKNGDPRCRHVMIFNRRTAQTFEQILTDIGDTVKIAANKLYTIDGKVIKSLQQLFLGPDVLIVGGKEPFKEMEGFSPRLSRQSHHSFSRGLHTRGGSDMIARRLQDRREKLKNTKGEWTVEVGTNKHPSTGTQAQVSLCVYGHKGNSGTLTLGTGDGTNFKSGGVDTFQESVGNIGEIYKIRIGHDNSGHHPGWLCDYVKMTDKHTKEELLFQCHRWMARDEDDSEICRELPAVRKREPILPVLRYEVTVHTGNLWNSGTESNVYMTVYGDRGDTGVRQLYKRDKSKPFQQGQTDTFSIEAVNLGHLRRVIVGHDGTGPGCGWFLEKIIIREPNSKPHEDNVFYCGRWLDEGEDDGKIVRELKIQEEYMDDILEKRNWDHEKWKFDKDSEVKFYSLVTGKALRIRSNLGVDCLADDFDDNAVFKVVPKKRTMVRMFSSKDQPKHYLAIDNGRITMQGMGGPYCEFRIRVQPDRSVMLESVKNPLQFVTFGEDGQPADVRGILDKDPTRRFFVYCKGMFRHRGIVMFCTSNIQAININENHSLQGTGKQNSLARFRVHKVSTGGVRMFESMAEPGHFIRLKDGKIDVLGERDEYSHFIVEKHRDRGYISLQSASQRGLYLGLKPDGRVWPTVDTGVNNIWLYLNVIEFGVPKSHSTEHIEESAMVAISQQEKMDEEETDMEIMQQQKEDEEETAMPTLHIEQAPAASLDDGEWTIQVNTIETLQGGDLALVVYGDLGNSGPINLGAPPGKVIFQAGNSDEFKANLSKLGNLNKIRLELAPKSSDKAALWKVRDVKLENCVTKEVLKFTYNKWLSLDHDDKVLMREMPVTRPGEEGLPMLRYYVMVHTGKETDAETEAHVYLNIYGELGDTGKRLLFRSNNLNPFRNGQVDIFEIEAASLGGLQKCIVGHDGTGDGQGWYLEQIVIRESENAKEEYIFPCERWLDTGQEDRKIERTLTLKAYLISAPPSRAQSSSTRTSDQIKPVIVITEEEEGENQEEEEDQAGHDTYRAGDWKIWTTTGSEESMGTTNDVILYVYGSEGKVGPITLGIGEGKDGYFKAGNTDEFKVFIGTDTGELYKLRIGHDDKDMTKGWFLQMLKVRDMIRGDEKEFAVSRWMSRLHDDGDVWREIPVASSGKTPLPVVNYSIEVYTGAQPGAETSAGVFICMYGERGDSGKRRLHKTAGQPFKEGAMDVFSIEAVSLGDIRKISVGQDGQGESPGWLLDKIIVKDPDRDKTFHFPCNRWLDEAKGDGKCEVDILARPSDSEGEYKLWIKTLEDSLLPNGGTASITVYGDKGKTKEIKLYAPNPTEEVFLPGNIDQFQVGVGDLGELYKIRISRDDTPKWQGWHMLEIKMQDVATQEEMVFNCDRWLSRDKEDFDVVREFPVATASVTPLPVLHYEVLVYVGNNWAAETDADVYITIFGKKGDTGKRLLYHSQTNSQRLQRGQVDTFLFEAVFLDELTHVEVGHDTKGQGAGVFIDQIKVTEVDGSNPTKQYVFPCRMWLDQGAGDGKTWRTLTLLDVVDKNAVEKTKNPSKKSNGKWSVTVKTSEAPGSGTHSQVYITAYGTKGKSDKEALGISDGESNTFVEGTTSEFMVTFDDIGELIKVWLEHDNENPDPSWHVDWLKLTDIDTDEEHVFYINKWFAKDKEDGLTCRELAVKRKGNSPLPEVQYLIYVKTGDYPEVSVRQGTALLNLIGHDGETGQRPLIHPYIGDTELWQPGKTDVFLIEAVSVGKLTEMQLQFEGKGKDKAWYVESVCVFEGFGAVSQTVFNCQRWIDVDNVLCDKFSVSEIRPSLCPIDAKKKWFTDFAAVQSSGQWSLWIYCGQQSDGGTTENVYMVVYGFNGQTKPIHLNDTEKLSRGAIVKLDINVGDIGAITKIQIFYGEDYNGSALCLQRLKMRDNNTGEEFNFISSKQIEGSEENPNGTIELAAIRPDVRPLQDDAFTLYVATSTQELAGTNADVYCEIFGDWGSTGKRKLRKSKSDQPFKKGQVDEFIINGLDLGNIKKVLIGHSEKGRGKGWQCDRVLIKSALFPTLKIFPCNRWMDTGCEDRKLYRELLPMGEIPVFQASAGQTGGKWTCSIHTADRSKLPNEFQDHSPKSRAVSLVYYGSKGVEGPLELTNDNSNKFLPGQVNVFTGIDLSSIGNLEKIRVCSGYEEDGNPVWTVEKVTLHGEDTDEEIIFDFSKWVGEVGGDIRKEQPVIRMGKGFKPVIQYHIEVYTSDEEFDSGTYSNVFITLYGLNSDTGRRHLNSSSSNKIKFQTGQVDIFTLEAVELGDLEKIVVAKGPGNPWYLDKIVIKPGEYANTQYTFTYNNWVGDKATQDREVEKIINRPQVETSSVVKSYSEDHSSSNGVWKIETETGGQKGDGTLTDIVIVMCGDKGETTPSILKSSRDNPFQIGIVDTCKILSEDVGELFKVRLGFKDNTIYKGWYLRKISCENEDTGDIFSYELNDWIIVDDQSDGWKEFPIVWPAIKVPQILKYHITVYMGQVHQSADSEVYIYLHGDSGSTGRRTLKHSLNNDKKFQSNQMDQFQVEAVSLGNLQKVTIGHEASGAGCGWFLKKIVIQESEESLEEVVFRCHRWFDEGEDDKKIERTLFPAADTDRSPSPSQLPVMPVAAPDVIQKVESEHGDTPKPESHVPSEPENRSPAPKSPAPEPVKPRTPTPTPLPPPGEPWTVCTVTGSEPGQGTVSAVAIVMYGAKGRSDPVLIGEDKTFQFEEGKTDEFDVRVVVDVGTLYKVRVGFHGDDHDISWYEDSSQAPSWFLEKITLTDMSSKQTYTFIANQWIRIDGEKDFWREFPVQTVDTEQQLPVKSYQVQVYTGDRLKAGTDANVSLEIVGERGDTGKRMLLSSKNNSNKFEQGATDLFELDAVDLGKLTSVSVSHDGANPGSGWFLDKVIVKESESSTEQYVFQCDKWLDVGEDDAMIKRTLPLTEVVLEVDELKGEPWTVSTVTGSEPGQGTVSAVTIVMYGDKGRSEPLIIGEDKNFQFEEGKSDEFEVRVLNDVGKVYKVRVGFHGDDHEISWYEDSSQAPSWFLEKLTLTDMSCEQTYTFVANQWIRIDGEKDFWREFPVRDTEQQIPMKSYQVQVYTGDRLKAGTDANVSLEIVGERGDTGKRMLLSSKNNSNKFEQGAMDLFELDAVDLGKMTSVSVSHDGANPGSGWFLDKVIVKESESSTAQYVFQCDKWLDVGEDDELISRDLTLTEIVEEPVIPDGEPWKVCTVTGSEPGQGTGSAVVFVIYGNIGQSEKMVIGDDDNFSFKEGQTEEFQLYMEGAVGQVYKVRVGFKGDDHDLAWYQDSSQAPSWFLQKLILTDLTSNKVYTFDCEEWIQLDGYNDFWKEFPVKEDSPADQLSLRNYEVEVYTGNEFKGGTDANVYLQIFGERGDTGKRRLLTSKTNSNKFEQGARDVFEIEAVDLGPLTKVIVGHDGDNAGSGWFLDKICIKNPMKTTEKYMFDCDRWLDSGQEESMLEREIPLTDIVDIVVSHQQTEPENKQPKEGDFRVYIVTSNQDNSGINAQVTLTVYGAGGNSGPISLGESSNDVFCTGQTNEFYIWLDKDDLGELRKIRLEHDNIKSGWRVEKLILHELMNDKQLEFDINKWLSFEEKNGDISVELPVHHPNRESWPVTSYIVETTTGEETDAGTNANVYVNMFGTLGDSGKRYLKNNTPEGTTFQPGQVDRFVIEAVGLGRVENIIVGHDGSGPEFKWHLDRVTVRETETAEKQYVFSCDSWLEDSDGLGIVEVELYMDRMEDVPKPDRNDGDNKGDNSEIGTHPENEDKEEE